jgi:hypothetical protein
MQAAAQLMDPDIEVVEVGGKKFAKGVTEVGSVAITGYDKDGDVIGIIPIQGSQNMEPMDLEAAIYEALSTLGATSAPAAPKTKTKKITTAMINEAADALMNDETTSLGKYTFEPIASGLGGTRVNIYVEPGMEDPVGYFMLDPGEYREPSDMLDAFYDKISEFLENNPDSEEGTGGTGPGAKFMPGYNPRYTDDDGNFDYGLYSEDRRKTIAYLRDRMGITRKDFPNDEEWKRTIRETMRDVIRNG